jgi:glycosyltransferase involved in cell wall biosynthesis
MLGRPIHIVHVMGSGGPGGVETFVLDLVRHLDPARFRSRVCIVGRTGPVVSELRDAGAETCVLESPGRLNAAAAFRYLRCLRSAPVDLLHLHVGGRMVRCLARLAGCRTIFTHVHGPPDEWIDDLRSGQRDFTRQFENTYGRGAQRIIACSQSVARMLTTHCPPLADRISVVLDGVDVQRFRPGPPDCSEVKQLRAQLGLRDTDLVAGFVGRLVRQKGIPHLLAVAEALLPEHPDLRFVVVGDGAFRASVEGAVRRIGQRRLIFLGERRDIPPLLSLFDLLIVPSEWEPLGIVILEAMAAARPVVAFGVDGIPEAALHGETGLLVPPGDRTALAAAVSQLLADASLRRRMGLAARARVEIHFDVSSTARTIASLYEQACGLLPGA